MNDGVDVAVMEINAAAMFLVHTSPLDLAVGEDGAAAMMVIVKICEWCGDAQPCRWEMAIG